MSLAAGQEYRGTEDRLIVATVFSKELQKLYRIQGQRRDYQRRWVSGHLEKHRQQSRESMARTRARRLSEEPK